MKKNRPDPVLPQAAEAGGPVITGKIVRLRRKSLGDARNDYAWQTDAELVRFDAATPLTIPFAHYIMDYTSQLRTQALTSLRFAIDTIDGRHIGNCSYYNIDEDRNEAEMGIIIGDRNYWNRGYGTDAVTTFVAYLFREKKRRRIHLKTLDWNLRAHRCFQKCGFTPCGNLYRDGYDFIIMEQYRHQWQQRQEKR